MRAAKRPGRLGIVVGGVVALAASTHLAQLDHAGWSSRPTLAAAATSATVFVLGDLLLLHLRVGRERYSFTWAELAVVVGLVALRHPWLPLVATLSVAAAHLMARRPMVKVLYNAASFSVGISLAQLAAGAVVGSAELAMPSTPRSWLALFAGALAFFTWNLASISLVLAVAQGMPFVSVVRRSLAMNLLVFAGNTTLGIVLVATAAGGVHNLLVVPPLALLLFLTYRGYLRAILDRDTWQTMQDISQRLMTAEAGDVVAIAVDEGAGLLRCEEVSVRLLDEPRTLTADDGDVRHELRPDRRQALVAPLVDRGLVVGQVSGTYRRRVAPVDFDLFGTFVNHVSASLSGARRLEEIHREGSKLRSVLGSTSDGIAGVDSGGRVTTWNPAMERLTGLSATDAIGQPLQLGHELETEDGERVSVAWLLDRLAAVGAAEVQLSVSSGPATRRWLSLAMSAVHDGGDEMAAVMVVRDITARREADEAKQAFVASVSHELRTPLTPLKGFLLTLMRHDVDLGPADTAAVYDRMLGQTERLERLIEDLLSVSQIEQGAFAIVPTLVNLDEAVASVVANYPGVTYVPGPRQPTMVMADGVRVGQVLDNLLSNARKYAPSGSVVVAVTESPGGGALVSVADQGPGIAQDQQELIFDRFRRLGTHLTQSASGAGLGLYIARHLVESMGGEIRVESEPGCGSTFSFSLPGVPLPEGVPSDWVLAD